MAFFPNHEHNSLILKGPLLILNACAEVSLNKKTRLFGLEDTLSHCRVALLDFFFIDFSQYALAIKGTLQL